MPSCSICYERFTSPVSLPCGHIFCRECVRRTVDSIKSCNVLHFCPTCRTSYSVVTLDQSLIPPYLRPHVLPPIRPVFFDDSIPDTPPSASGSSSTASHSTTAAPTTSPTPSEAGHFAAEANALRLSCTTWRRRAEVHAAANTGLLGFARAAKDSALRMRAERDAARNRCELLKRKLVELMCVFQKNINISLSDGFSSTQGRHLRFLLRL
ncbi:hypothetical protein C8R43DRAFT_888974 [Mycena crocata]|nr:hypothetical protein C8R43DRAFT_888974 [Mycena crocata]